MRTCFIDEFEELRKAKASFHDFMGFASLVNGLGITDSQKLELLEEYNESEYARKFKLTIGKWSSTHRERFWQYG